MNVNWKLRLMNKTTLTTLAVALITFIYSVLSALAIVPPITQEQSTDLLLALISFLSMVGIVVDPTTEGLSDSARALAYEKPAESVDSE